MSRTTTRSPGRAHDEHRLIAGFARGEPEAFDELFSRFGPLVYGIGLRCFGDEEGAAGFAERAFISLRRGAPRYRWSSIPLETWIACQVLAVAIRDSRPTPDEDTEPNERRTRMMPNPLWLEQLLADRRTHQAAVERRRERGTSKERPGALRSLAAVAWRPIRERAGRARERAARGRRSEPTLDALETRRLSSGESIW